MPFPVIKQCTAALVRYLNALVQLFDPITDVSESETQRCLFGCKIKVAATQTKKKNLFLWPALYIALLQLFGVIGLEVDAVGFWAAFGSWSSLATSEHIFCHQIMPREVWPQMDVFFAIAFVGGLTGAIAIYASPPLGEAHKLKIVSTESGGYCLKSKECQKCLLLPLGERNSRMIVSARALLYRYFYPLLLSFVLILLANLYTIVYLNGVYRCSVLSLLFWFFIFPVSAFHAFYGNVYISFPKGEELYNS